MVRLTPEHPGHEGCRRSCRRRNGLRPSRPWPVPCHVNSTIRRARFERFGRQGFRAPSQSPHGARSRSCRPWPGACKQAREPQHDVHCAGGDEGAQKASPNSESEKFKGKQSGPRSHNQARPGTTSSISHPGPLAFLLLGTALHECEDNDPEPDPDGARWPASPRGATGATRLAVLASRRRVPV